MWSSMPDERLPLAVALAAANPWLERRVLTYAHQCGAWEAPSSTLFALRRALELGVTGIELDVHATADRHLVVCHDGTVDRTTNSHGPIHSMTLAEVRTLDNAYWFVPGGDETQGLEPGSYPYRMLGQRRIRSSPRSPRCSTSSTTTLDVARQSRHQADRSERRALRRAPGRELSGRRGTDRVIVASFLDIATDSFAKYAPTSPSRRERSPPPFSGGAVHEGEAPPPSDHVALQVPASQGDLVVVDELLVRAADEYGMAVHVWTINDEAEMARLLDLGVDGLISDLPTPLVALVAARGLAHQP